MQVSLLLPSLTVHWRAKIPLVALRIWNEADAVSPRKNASAVTLVISQEKEGFALVSPGTAVYELIWPVQIVAEPLIRQSAKDFSETPGIANSTKPMNNVRRLLDAARANEPNNVITEFPNWRGGENRPLPLAATRE